MPMIDAYIPEGALAPQAEAQLMRELTDILIRHEDLDPDDPRVRDAAWIFVHRPTAVYRAGALAAAPIFRIVASVPEGQYTDAARASLVKEVTAAIARAEGTPADEIGARAWIFPTEIGDGGWGSRGSVRACRTSWSTSAERRSERSANSASQPNAARMRRLLSKRCC
ncbi:tautomerase family protein [Burkholderia sp. ABCPW 111]|uniref:tautomerase family protein n=1 Tax=Burkholderia sp. ABCPW 111 TaxID=1820025 RepID=UPI000531DC86|nr:Tautomerase enzyme [Burkholderia sp. ABCPW 111]KGS04888.1 tautomerase enzyme family protein [Burkholderia sp. ABCPW 111]